MAAHFRRVGLNLVKDAGLPAPPEAVASRSLTKFSRPAHSGQESSGEISVTLSKAEVGAVPASPPDFLAHPRGLAFLFATEMWERFSYYGMRALLVLYMTKYLLLDGHKENVAGLATLKHGFESVFGPLAIQPLSSQIYGFYTALVYLTPIFGGLLADRVLGRRRTIMLGAAIMAVGHFMMAIEALFLFALLMLIIGNGAFKPNISVQVGDLYAPGDARRDRAFSIFYVGINLGAFLAPLVCGTLGEELGWHFGFAAAGVGMTVGLFTYIAATPHLPPADTPRARPHAPLSDGERGRLAALAALFVPVTLFWAVYEQQGNTIALWADEFTDRTLPFLAFQIPTTWFQAFNPLMIFAFTPLLLALWRRQSAESREPSTVTKMGLGCLGLALANGVLILAAWYAGAGKASWLWLLVYFIVLTMGELYISPIGLSLVSQVAPPAYLSVTMGAWLATSFIGNFGAGWLGSFWSGMDKAHFFALMSAIALAASAAIFALRKPVERALGARTAK
jgi:proton-dependent oligopeptide transporter, POT family